MNRPMVPATGPPRCDSPACPSGTAAKRVRWGELAEADRAARAGHLRPDRMYSSMPLPGCSGTYSCSGLLHNSRALAGQRQQMLRRM